MSILLIVCRVCTHFLIRGATTIMIIANANVILAIDVTSIFMIYSSIFANVFLFWPFLCA